MRRPLTLPCLLCLLCGLALPAAAQLNLSLDLTLPGVSIGIDVPAYPNLVRVPGHPVYYAPGMRSNFFFYDGMYWVYQGDDWYASDWYDGPWGRVQPQAVPLFVLRIPVRYYRNPPSYFRGWGRDAPPRWGEHWGPVWQQQRNGWDRWDRRATPAPAPLPVYQRRYPQDRYPQPDRQRELRSQNYRYQPRDQVVREHFQQRPEPERQAEPVRPRGSNKPEPRPNRKSDREGSRDDDRDRGRDNNNGRGQGQDNRK
jgi:hypothetical protein